MFSCKIHEKSGMRILAIADSDIIGKSFLHNKIKIEVKKEFYGEEIIGSMDAVKLVKKFLKPDTHINIIGNRIAELLVNEKIIKESSVLDLSGVKHAQIYCVE